MTRILLELECLQHYNSLYEKYIYIVRKAFNPTASLDCYTYNFPRYLYNHKVALFRVQNLKLKLERPLSGSVVVFSALTIYGTFGLLSLDFGVR